MLNRHPMRAGWENQKAGSPRRGCLVYGGMYAKLSFCVGNLMDGDVSGCAERDSNPYPVFREKTDLSIKLPTRVQKGIHTAINKVDPPSARVGRAFP